MSSIVIASAARTPVGSFNGVLSSVAAHDLGAVAIKAALERAGVAPGEVDEVILGQILSATARGRTLRGRLRWLPAFRRKQQPGASTSCAVPACARWRSACSRSLRATPTLSSPHGQESMSLAPHAMHMRNGVKMGAASMVDTMMYDALTDAFYNYLMGNTAENVAKQWQLSRDEQDAFAVNSQNKAEAAQKAGKFKDEIAAVTIKGRKGDTVVEEDEYIKHGVTVEGISKLRPAFDKEGTVTAANASGINDGAAATVLMSEAEASKRGITPMARIVSWATAGVDPQIMGTGPIPASRKALEKAGWSVGDLDLVEANEAFAAQACAVNKDMGWDPAIVNVNGGAIAIGHPVGASGARILNTLLFEMVRRDAKKGLATLCIGGGMGVALCVERD